MPRVSVVTPCYNAAPYIVATIESIVAQTDADWEYIIVDDGSSDDSIQAATSIVDSDDRISLVVQPNGGVASARSTGFAASDSTSEYLVFLDADDLLAPTFLDTMSAHLDAHPNVGLVYCGQRDIDESGNPIADEQHKPRYVRDGWKIRKLDAIEAETPLDVLVSRFEAIPSTCMFRRSAFELTTGWRKVGVVEDKDMGIQMALAAPVHHLAQNLTSYRHHSGQRHLDKFYESMDALRQSWWNDTSIDPSQRDAVRKAIVFDRRVAAFLTRREASDLARDGKLVPALRTALRSVKQLGQSFGLTVRRRLDRS